MAASPDWKVYRGGEYVAACKHAEDAAALVALSGGEVRHGHSKKDVVWTEGRETFPAGESYDGAAELMHKRVREMYEAARARVNNPEYRAACDAAHAVKLAQFGRTP